MDSFYIDLIENSDDYKQYKAIEKKIQEKNEAVYARLKDHPSMKKLIEIGGLCSDAIFVMQEMERIEQLLDNGMSYSDAFTQFAYSDNFTGNLALLMLAEERCNASIISAEQWRQFAKIDLNDMDWIKSSFIMALEARYSMALAKALRKRGKYKDLMALNPDDFRLPGKWKSMLGYPMTKADVISRVLHRYIEDYLFSTIKDVTLHDIAKSLEAPLIEIVKASMIYD